MKIYYSILISILLLSCSNSERVRTLKIMQFNIWHEGTKFPEGYKNVLDEIIGSDADIIALSEVRNYNDQNLNERMVKDLKERGLTYYSLKGQDTGVLSKYPILKQEEIYPFSHEEDAGSVTKAIIDFNGKEVVVYSAHLDYRNCAIYLPRGYHSSTWKPLENGAVDNIDLILKDNTASKRDEQIKSIVDDLKHLSTNTIAIIAGDFNEASHLDWIESNKNLYGHNNLVIEWPNTKKLEEYGFIDSFREIYPNPITHPGFTFPSYNPNVAIASLIWAPDADDRDRIDFIFYRKNTAITLKDSYIIGPHESISKSKIVTEIDKEDIQLPNSDQWPTDHKALMSVFEIKNGS